MPGFPAVAKEAKVKPPKSMGQKIARVVWSQSLKTASPKKSYFPEGSAPVVSGGQVLVGTHGGVFSSLNASTGKVTWSYDSKGAIASQGASNGEAVFFGNSKGMVTALEASSGKKIWEVYVGGEVLGQPAVDSGTVYVVTTSREVYALNAQSGEQLWVVYVRGFEPRFTMRGNSPVVLSGDSLYIGFADGQVASLSRRDGSVRWSRTLNNGAANFLDVDAGVLLDPPYLYAAGYFGSLVKMEMGSGKTVWSKDLKSGTDLASDADSVYVSSVDGHVIAFDKKAGTRRWEVALNSGALSAPSVVGDVLIVGSQTGGAFVLSAAKGEVLQTLPISSGYLTNAASNGSTAYILSSGSKVYSISLAR